MTKLKEKSKETEILIPKKLSKAQSKDTSQKQVLEKDLKVSFKEVAKSAAKNAQSKSAKTSIKYQKQSEKVKLKVEQQATQASQVAKLEKERKSAKLKPAENKIEAKFVAAKEKPRNLTKAEQEKQRLAKEKDVKGRKVKDQEIAREAQEVATIVKPAIELTAINENLARDTLVAMQTKKAAQNALVEVQKHKNKLTLNELAKEAQFEAAKTKKRAKTPAQEEALRLDAQKGARVVQEVLGKEAAVVGAAQSDTIGKKAQQILDKQAQENTLAEQEAKAHKTANEVKRVLKKEHDMAKAEKDKKSKTFVPITSSKPSKVVVKPLAKSAPNKGTVSRSKIAELAKYFTDDNESAKAKVKREERPKIEERTKVKAMTSMYNRKTQEAKSKPLANASVETTRTIANQSAKVADKRKITR